MSFLQAVANEVRERHERRLFGRTKRLTLGEARQRLAATGALASRVQDGTILAGYAPPTPPTLRARAGAVLVAVLRRAMFWLTGQVREYEVAATESLREQAALLESAVSEIEGLESVLRDLSARLDRHDELLSRIASVQESIVELASRQLALRTDVAGLRLGLATVRDHAMERSAQESGR